VSTPELQRLEPALQLLSDSSWRGLLPALEEAPVNVLIFVGADHRLAFLNRHARHSLGRRRLGTPAAAVFSEYPDYVAILEAVRSSGHTHTLSRSPIVVGQPGGGSMTILVDMVFSPLRDTDGRTMGVFCQAVNVTSQYADDERLRIADALNRVGLELSRSLEVPQVTAAVTRLAAEVFLGWGILDLWQPDGTLLRAAVTHHDPAMQELIQQLTLLPRISGRPDGHTESYATRSARTGQTFVGRFDADAMAAAASSPVHADVMLQLRPLWYMIVPVQIGPRRLGSLTVVRPEGEPPFEPADRAVLEQYAERAAIALAHARDYDEQRQSALTLQRTLLPAQPKRRGDMALAVRYQAGGAGSEVGGDWYDTVELERGSIGIAVGDVQGHDLTAAALMGQVRAVVHAHAHSGLPPARIAEEANAFVTDASSERLVTLSYLQIYPVEGLAVWVRAGHLPAVVVAPDGSVSVLHGRGGLPLGVDPGATWNEETVHLPPGALLAVFTDGLVESPTRSFDEGVDLLAELLAAYPDEDVDALADRLLGQLAPGEVRRDDVALVLVRLPTAARDRHRRVLRRLPAAPSSAPLSRWFVQDVLRHWRVDEDTMETAALLVTELVSNATRHSDAAIELRLSLSDGRLRVSVFDDSHRLPQVTEASLDETSGRGLQLVELLAAGWGVETEDRGKAVWFELDVAPAAAPAHSRAA
jgi:serine phosphatase RsbU (regulator of sigma subunit)/anti-sigma regulatory factor (Ser/Thr protein kinase)